MGRLAVLVWEQLYPFVFRTTLDRDATEDILQETLLTMLRRLDSLRDDERFWPWIYRIAWSKIRNRFRDRRLWSLYERMVLRDRQKEDAACVSDISPLDAQIREETLREVRRPSPDSTASSGTSCTCAAMRTCRTRKSPSEPKPRRKRPVSTFTAPRKSLRKQLACRV